MFVPATSPKLGGVDPLGLRQINFDLMDQVIPGLNNVARHIRPFVVVTWAWRRAHQIAQALGVTNVPVDNLRDFVDRIEVIYAWSQFLQNPDADLPGRQVLAPLVQSDEWTFGGTKWRNFRKSRRYSTAFTAPITYGPSLKTLGWVATHRSDREVLIPTPASQLALDAFEARIKHRLDHSAFSKFGTVTVTKQEAKRWSEAWALGVVTEAEKNSIADMLLGSGAPLARREGLGLMIAAVKHAGTRKVATVRRTMAGRPSNFAPPSGLDGAGEAWRRVQVRQLFRLSLEALLYWTICQVEHEPKSTESLVSTFLAQAGRSEDGAARAWLRSHTSALSGPDDFIRRIQEALDDPLHAELAPTIRDGLSASITEAPEHGQIFERADRLPLFRARREAEAWAASPVESFLRHVFENWLLAQHVYWSVGRGLADARARGKTLLRLKIVLEESGWTLAPGVSRGSVPVPTADRLETALTLASEAGLLAIDES
jgi:hypothetical protein